MRCAGPHHRKTDPLECLCQVQDRGQGSLIFFLCFAIKSFHLPAEFPTLFAGFLHFALSVASQSTRYFCCHFATSGALRASHQRVNVSISAIGLSLVTIFGVKKNIVVQACCGNFPLRSTFFTPVFALQSLDASRLPPISSIPHFSKACPPCSARFRHIPIRYCSVDILSLFTETIDAKQQMCCR